MKRFNNRIIFSLLLVIVAIALISRKQIIIPEPLYKLPYFSYTNQHSEIFTVNNLSNKISIIDFFFTSCEGPCPAMNRYMKYLAEKFSALTLLAKTEIQNHIKILESNFINSYWR